MPSPSETLDADLKYARARVNALRQRIIADAGVARDEAFGVQALQEIDAAEEELRVVEEELHARADEILATRGELEVQRERYRALFDMAPEPYFVTDLRGKVLEANRRCGVLFNADPKFVIGKPLASFVALGDRERVQQLFSSFDESTYRGELHVLPRRSDPIRVSVSARRGIRGRGEHETILWLLRLGHDRSDERGKLKALRARIAELEQENGELRAQLKGAAE
jgi:PAS domain S-box-containing protein